MAVSARSRSRTSVITPSFIAITSNRVMVLMEALSLQKMLQTHKLATVRTLDERMIGAVELAAVCWIEVELNILNHGHWRSRRELINRVVGISAMPGMTNHVAISKRIELVRDQRVQIHQPHPIGDFIQNSISDCLLCNAFDEFFILPVEVDVERL